ncbi:hypothetical protein A2335_01015 [Candidatus Peregrinibacteria bacterium RIFOXYB2_FULL_32_7]|nr:MAG: hypothetical protein A2335_01015 [Candidatus Peregrinibacteria bacterium RIFOXYB2_FULL_32_7]
MVELNEALAELIGAFIGDGCMSSYMNNGRIRNVTLFTGNWKNDVPYYQNRIIPIVTKYLNGTKNIYHRKSHNCMNYVLCSKEIFQFFCKLNLPVGVKGNKIKIPKEVEISEKLTLACVRGIFNTDGSVYRRYSKQYAGHSKAYRNYAIVQFKMKSLKVIKQIKKILEKQGIKINKITKVLNCHVIRITDQNSIKLFFETCGFTHPYHKGRYLNIIKKPDRNKLLKGDMYTNVTKGL